VTWDDRWERARVVADPAGAFAPVRVAAEHRGAYRATASADVAWIELPGKAFHDAGDKRALPTVGDWVLVEGWPEAVAGRGAAIVRAILPRRSLLVRRAAGPATAPQPLAANVDVGIVMTSANTDLVPARLDRYLSLLRDGGIEPVIAVSKLDLAADAEAALAEARTVHPRVVGVSVVTGIGLVEIRALAQSGRTAIVLGSSGVGKSSLLNALLGTSLATGEIRADERGRHTTTHRELFETGGGAWIDTPGMRELGVWLDEADAEEDEAFDDIAELAAGCRFRDCRHVDEPGCAVRGAVTLERLASFHKLAGERRAADARQAGAKKLAETRKARAKKPPPSE
jgi:ribosome biogenesis GTPase